MNSIIEQEKKWLLDEKYQGTMTDEYHKECLLLEQGMPVAYLIGNIEFLGCHIDLSSKPLIPRPETEYWTDLFIKKVEKDESQELEVLDLFAGSGCIGIACAKNLPESHVDFGEINPNNIKQIEQNIEINKLESNTQIFQSDVFSNIPQKEYDFILTNPPYIDRSKESQVQSSVLDNEDSVALFADNQGLAYVYQLIDEGFDYLKLSGELWIEFDSWQTELIDKKLSNNKNWSHSYLQDQYKKDRVLILIRN